MPAGFWTNFKKSLLVKNISDQGPYGGTRAMYWKTDKQNTFISKTILDFASKNGWQFVDSLYFPADSIEKWKLFGEDIFPLSGSGFSPFETNDYEFKKFPRWITSNIVLYKFKTGWSLLKPGTDDSTEENGFVIINDKGTEMSVYHSWGD